jgi:hypothetical protein
MSSQTKRVSKFFEQFTARFYAGLRMTLDRS